MNSIHDMGGMDGFGPIPYEKNEPVFHHEWEGRAYAMVTQTRIKFPSGIRKDIERMDPAHYLTSTYYEKWLHARIKALIDVNAITRAEFDEWVAYLQDNPDYAVPQTENREHLTEVLSNIHDPHCHRKELDVSPAFQIGDEVYTQNMHPFGHTRLPRYARGKRGTVVNYYGIQECDDILSSGEVAHPQPLYSVCFDGQELWGDSAEANSLLYLDIWEMYLKIEGQGTENG
ncbi:MAG: nitrile hydratase subunit beta [Chloroflexota bacterium]